MAHGSNTANNPIQLGQNQISNHPISIVQCLSTYVFSNVERYRVVKVQVVFDKNDASFLQLKPNWDV